MTLGYRVFSKSKKKISYVSLRLFGLFSGRLQTQTLTQWESMLKKGCLPTNKSALHQTPPNATQPYLPPTHQYFQSELESPQQKPYNFQVVIMQ